MEGDQFTSCTVLEIAATEQHVATVILCHGMGESAEHWHKMAQRWSWPDYFPHIKFVFPQAPQREIEFLGNAPLTAWFNVPTTNDITGGTYDGLSQHLARAHLSRLVLAETTNRNIPPTSVYIGGYSQGGALALSFAAYHPEMIAGAFAVSGYLPMLPVVRERLYSPTSTSTTTTSTTTVAMHGGGEIRRPRYFISHGTNDTYVKYPWAEWTVEALREAGCEVEFKTYLRGGHMIRPQTRRDLEGWLRARVPYEVSYGA